MYMFYLWEKKILSVILILLFLLTVFSSSLGFSNFSNDGDNINWDDGVYYVDGFTSNDVILSSNCSIKNSKIVLNPEGSNSHIYNFQGWNRDSEDRAYIYDTILFIPYLSPMVNITWLKEEKEIDRNIGYTAIANKDGHTYPLLQFPKKSILKWVHHFRFKITDDLTRVNKIKVHWYGEAESCAGLEIYYWQPNKKIIPMWIKANETYINSSWDYKPIELAFTLDKDFPVSKDKYIDICIVATPEYSKKCALFTDYIEVAIYGLGYATTGTVYSKNPLPTSNVKQWGYLTWHDQVESKTYIRYQLLYETDNGSKLVEDTFLPGNSNGFYTHNSINYVSIRNIPTDYKLIIKATLYTTDPSVSPSINSWGITWQNEQDKWKDLFSSDLRIESKNNVLIENGEVHIIQSLYDWPLYGQNPANTRSSPGKAPNATNNYLRWYTAVVVGGEQRDPIVKGKVVYIVSKDGRKIYSFDTRKNDGLAIPNPWVASSEIPEYNITSTPAVNDEIIVVATGSSARGGGIENKIYAYDKNILSNRYKWRFSYSSIHPGEASICYSGSPIIYGDKIYITSWSGNSALWDKIGDKFNFSSGNNKVICLNTDGVFQWEFNLPAGSFSTPAVYNNFIVVGCENILGDSIFAIDSNGKKIWSRNIGPIGYTAPVVYNGKIFVLTKKLTSIPFTAYTQLTALDINGDVLWNKSIGDSQPDAYRYAGSTSPAVYNNKIFVVSPDGILYAIDMDGKELWNKTIYTRGLTGSYITTSPAYADGRIYIGTPDGKIFAINATNGDTEWFIDTVEGSPVISSPIITDGLLIYCIENGMMICRGEIQTPTGEQYSGYMISLPIYLLPGYEWKRFYATTNTTNGNISFSILSSSNHVLLSDIHNDSSLESIKNQKIIKLKADFKANITSSNVILYDWMITYGLPSEINGTIFYESSFSFSGMPPICSIDVQNQKIGIQPKTARYRFIYTNSTGKHTSDWINTSCTGINGTRNREKITADLSLLNFTDPIKNYWKIQFSIKDIEGNETYSQWHNITFIRDEAKPIFYTNTFSPRYTNISTPICRIDAMDVGTKGNVSGINVGSARYTIEYTDQSGKHIYSASAECTGRNGTTSKVTITADISKLSFSNSIISTDKIRFYIEDMAGNSNYSEWFNISMDKVKPTSYINNTIPNATNSSPVHITAYAADDKSGIKTVELYYHKKGDASWHKFGSDSTPPYEWDFTIGRDDGGEYELCSIAIDNADNIEDFPATSDVTFLFDPNPPYKPVFNSEYRFIEPKIPSFSNITFEDDYKLDKVEYRMNFEGINEWKTIADDINSKNITPTWSLTENEWDQLVEDQPYYIYFRLTDTLGNIYETESMSNAMKVIKDLERTTPFDPDISDFNNFHWDNKFIIRVHVNKTEVSKIQLYYRFSPDNKTWSNWTKYGEDLTNGSFSWSFIPPNGSGYYSFRVEAWDNLGMHHISSEKYVRVIIFPFVEITTMIILVFVFMGISIQLFKRYSSKPKSKKTYE